MLLLFAFALYILGSHAVSTALATSPITTVFVSTYYATRSSVTRTLTSTIGGDGPPTCSTSIVNGATQVACVDDPIAITLVTLYGTSVSSSLSTITSIVGYTTIYSSVSQPTNTPSATASTSLTTEPVTRTSTITNTIVSDGSTTTSSFVSRTTSSMVGTVSASPGIAAGTSDASTNSSNGGLSTGLKAAIAVAAVLGVALGVVLVVFLAKRRQKKQKKLNKMPPEFNTGAAMGQHELYGDNSRDHAAIAIAAAGRLPVEQPHEKYGQATNEAPAQEQRFYENYGSGRHEMYGGEMPEAGSNIRYEMGPDRRLHELDALGRRI